MKKILLILIFLPTISFALCELGVSKEDKEKCVAMCSQYSNKDDPFKYNHDESVCEEVWRTQELPDLTNIYAPGEKTPFDSEPSIYVDDNYCQEHKCTKYKINIKKTEESEIKKWKKKQEKFKADLKRKEKEAEKQKAKEEKRRLKIKTKCAKESEDARTEFAAQQIYGTCLERNGYWDD